MLAFCKLCHDRRAAIIYWLVNLRFPEYTGYNHVFTRRRCTISGLWLIFSMMDRECSFRHRFVGWVLYGGIMSTGFHEKKFVFVNTPARNTVETVSSNFPFTAIKILYLTVKTEYFFKFKSAFIKCLIEVTIVYYGDTVSKNIFWCILVYKWRISEKKTEICVIYGNK